MNDHEHRPELFSARHEHALRNNLGLIAVAAAAGAYTVHEAPQLADFGFLGVCLVTVPAVGRMLEHRSTKPSAD